MNYRGHVKGGVIVLDGQTALAEGTAVVVELVEAPAGNPENKPKASESPHDDLAVEPRPDDEEANNSLLQMLELAGPTGIPDLAINLDHYLYGHPKVDDEQ